MDEMIGDVDPLHAGRRMKRVVRDVAGALEVKAVTARLRAGTALETVAANIEETINRTVQAVAPTILIGE